MIIVAYSCRTFKTSQRFVGLISFPDLDSDSYVACLIDRLNGESTKGLRQPQTTLGKELGNTFKECMAAWVR